MQFNLLLRGSTPQSLGAPCIIKRPLHQAARHRLAVPRVSSAQDSVTDAEAERFEKIAAALVEKLKDLPDVETEPEGTYPGTDTEQAAGCCMHSLFAAVDTCAAMPGMALGHTSHAPPWYPSILIVDQGCACKVRPKM